ncbi:MAG: PilN domain-containing protein [Anaerohalosphaeraceae bacterium]
MKTDRKKESLGIVLTDAYIEAVCVQAAGSQIIRLRSARADLPPGEVCAGWVQSPARTAARIRKMLTSARISLREAVVVVPDRQTTAQILDLPAELPSNMQKFIHTEMRFSPILAKRTPYADYRLIGADDDGKEKILAVLTTRECIRSLVETFRLAGIRIQSLQTDFCAVYQAAESFCEETRASKNLLLASLTGQTLTVCVYLERKLDFVQRFSREGQTDIASFLFGQIRTIQQFYELEKGISFPHHGRIIVVLDQTDGVKNALSSALEGLWGRTVIWITPDWRPNGIVPKDNRLIGAAALGAAWTGIQPSAQTMPDLLPPDVPQLYAWHKSLRKTVAAAALMIAGFYAAARLGPLNASADSLSPEPLRLARLAESQKQAKEKLDRLRDLHQSSRQLLRQKNLYSFSSVFDEIAGAVPSSVQMTSLEMDRKGHIGIAGRALSLQAVHQFAAQLGQSPRISNTQITESRLSASSGRMYEFRIVCRMNPTETGEKTGEKKDAEAAAD